MYDFKKRVVKEGERVRMQEDVPSIDGMLYKDSIVIIDSIEGNKARVKDSMGKIYWVEGHHISSSFL
tara:strand:- start:2104 stop:2304 length:201 start_codon:yes stop_codon:yes gene_type:complete